MLFLRASKTEIPETNVTRFADDRHGGIAIWAALLAPAFMAVAALSVDIGRMNALENDLQLAADAYARVAAFELDGRPDAIDRAATAVSRLIENEQRFGDDGRANISVQSIRYLTGVPESDFDPITSDYVTTSSTDALYAEVTVTPVTITTLFPVSIVNGKETFDLEASAVAKTDQGICNAAPLFMCNPLEEAGIDIATAALDRSFRRRLMLMKGKSGKGKGAKYFPGNFGYLQPNENGASALTEALAAAEPALCYSKEEGVELRTGNVSSAAAGFNTRFDIFDGSFKSEKGNPAYAPAPNVTKGYTGSSCNSSADPSAMGLPRDECFYSDSCTDLGGRYGDGDWDVAAYMAVNHGSPTSITIGSETFTINYASGAVSPEKPSRYEIYSWEVDNNRIPGTPAYPASTTPENGAPQCYTGGSASGASRRVMKVAILDCIRLDEEYDINGSSAGRLPVSGFAKVFVTEPMGTGGDSIIWGEIIGLVSTQDEDRAIEVARVVR